MRDFADVQDELAKVRDYIECASMACGHMDKEYGNPVRAVLSDASERLTAIGEAIDAIKISKRDI